MIDLPSILTDAEVTTYAALIALLIGIAQAVSFVPMPEGSRARAIACAVLAALFVGLSASGADLSGPDLVIALIFSFTALAAASLGINRAGSFVARQASEAADGGSGAG